MSTHPVRQSSFVGGEISPERYADTDKPHYLRGLRTCRNVVPAPHGEAVNRPGTKYVCAVKDSTTKPRLVQFIFSDGQSFVLEIGNLYVRFVTNGGQVTSGGLTYEIVAPWAIADVDRLKFAQVGDVIVVTHPSYAPRDITRISNTNWTITATIIASGGAVTPWISTAATFDSVLWDQVPAAYNPVTAYVVGNRVTYSGGYVSGALNIPSYICIQNGTGKQPDTNPDYWQFDSWSSTATFGEEDYAYRNGILYISLQPRNINKDPSNAANAAWWTEAADVTHPQREWYWKFSFLYTDSRGVSLESLPSPILLRSPTTKWPLAPDRPAKLTPITSALAAVSFQYTITGIRWYRGRNGLFGWRGDTSSDGTGAGTPSFKDDGGAPDFSKQPPAGTNQFLVANGAGTTTPKYPAVVIHHDQRRVFMRQDSEPHGFIGSAVGDFSNFDRPVPVNASDSFRWKLAAEQLEEIRASVSLERLLLFTGNGEWSTFGQQGDVLSAVSVNARRHTKWGSTWLDPVVVQTHAIFVTKKGNRVRNMFFDLAAMGYLGASAVPQGRELTVHGRHLLKKKQIVDWAYQPEPHSVIWAVRDDGVLLSLTYDPAAQVVAWARHDTAAGDKFERVCCVPEGDVDAVYFVVKRGASRYIERLSSYDLPLKPNGDPDDVRFAVVIDAALSFDGRNTGVTTMMVTGATFAGGDNVTITASLASFAATDVGDEIVIDADGTPTRIQVTAFTDATHLTGKLVSNLPAAFQAVPTTSWAWARDTITGLGHLEGRTVSVLGDGVVQGPFVVAGGQVGPLDPAVIVQAGLPYLCDVELLDVGGTQARTAVKSVEQVEFEVVATRGLYAGPSFDKLQPVNQRTVADSYGAPALVTDRMTSKIKSGFTKGGRACLRQVDPLPFTLIAVTREVVLGGKS